MSDSNIKIASETGCPYCWGSGVQAIDMFTYETCLWCGGTGKIEKEEKDNDNQTKKE